MEPILLDSSFREMYVLDKFKSLIWTDRYDTFGDFEIVAVPNTDIWTALATTAYLKLKESEHLMFLELINITSKAETGYELIMKGRSLESMLERRIVWDPTTITGNLQSSVHTLLNDSIILPTDPLRDISNFVFHASNDFNIISLTTDAQFWGESLDEVISSLCRNKNIGFKIVLLSETSFEFRLYAGINRSYDQTSNPHIVFAPEFDNLLESDYVKTDEFLKTTALVLGEEGVGNFRYAVIVDAPTGGGSGLTRRELFIEANGITRNIPGGGQLTDEEYAALLSNKGVEELAKNVSIEAFNGEIDTGMYNYGEDFLMGDVLQIKDDFGHSAKMRVVEIIFSQDPSGTKIYPTFNIVE